MKKLLIFMAAVFMICLVFGPKDKDLEKARRKNGLELYTYYDGYTFCYEKEFPHRIYVEDKNMKFVWYKLRYAYVPIYEPYMYSDGIQSCLDLEKHKIIPYVAGTGESAAVDAKVTTSSVPSDKELNNVEGMLDSNANRNETQELMLSQTYTNKYMGLSFMYPDGWTVVEEATNGPVCVVSPREPMLDSNAACIMIEKGDIDASYFSATMSEFEDVLLRMGDEDICVLSLDNILLSGHSTRRLVYTVSSDGVSLKQIFYFYVIDSEMFVIGCSTYEYLWDKYESVFEEIMDSYVITDTLSISANIETNIPDSENAKETLEEIPFGYEGEENYTDYIEWGGNYDDGWMDTTLTFSLYSDGTQDPGCGYMTTYFRGMENSGKLYYLGGNEFQWESEGYDSLLVETYYVCAVYNNGTYQLELYNSDGEYEVTFTLYERYIP